MAVENREDISLDKLLIKLDHVITIVRDNQGIADDLSFIYTFGNISPECKDDEKEIPLLSNLHRRADEIETRLLNLLKSLTETKAYLRKEEEKLANLR